MKKRDGLEALFFLEVKLMVFPYVIVYLQSCLGKFGFQEYLPQAWGFFLLSYVPLIILSLLNLAMCSESEQVHPRYVTFAKIFVWIHFMTLYFSLFVPVAMTGLEMFKLSLLWLGPTEMMALASMCLITYSKKETT